MTNLVPLIVFLPTLFLHYFLREFPNLPENIGYVTDVAIAAITPFIVLRLIVNRGWAEIPVKYLLVFLGFVLVGLATITLNGVSADTVFAGFRRYFLFVPMFLIPFAFKFSESDLKIQLWVIAGILFLQIPISVWQRFVEFQGQATGDNITGTFSVSTSLSIIGSGAILVVSGLYLDKRLHYGLAMLLAFLFLIPPALSETKITPILLIAGGGALLLSRRRLIDTRQMVVIAFAGSVLFGMFIFVYDQLYSKAEGYGYIAFMTDKEGILDTYNLTGAEAKPMTIAPERDSGIVGSAPLVTEQVKVGRLDSLRMPFDALFPNEIVYLCLGLGIGNVDSTFGSGADYGNIKYGLGGSDTGLSILIWETGVFGAALYILFLLFLTSDSLRLSSAPGYTGTLGAVTFAMCSIALICLIYSNMFLNTEISLLLTYLMGLMLKERTNLQYRKTLHSIGSASVGTKSLIT